MPPQKKPTSSQPATDSTPQTQFGHILKNWRKKTDLSQAAVARSIDSDHTQISRYETGAALPTAKTFYAMLAVYVGNGGCLDAAEAVEATRLVNIRLTPVDLAHVVETAHKYRLPYAKEFEQTIASAFGSPDRSQAEAQHLGLSDTSAVISETAQRDTVIPAELESLAPSESLPAVSEPVRPQLLIIPDSPTSERLTTDELIQAVLEWEAQGPPIATAEKLWNILKSEANLEKLHSRRRLEFLLTRWAEGPDWNWLEWDWLDDNLAELAQRLAAEEGLASLSAQATLVTELGQIAVEAIRLSDPAVPPSIRLDAVLNLWPASATRLIRHWLEQIVQLAPFKLAFSAENKLVFESPEEAHYLAAKYLLEKHSPKDIANRWGREERLRPILPQVARQLHYSGQTAKLLEFLQTVLRPNLFTSSRPLAAAELLAACAPIAEAQVRALQSQVETELLKLWEAGNYESKIQIASLFRELNPSRLSEHIQTTLSQDGRQQTNLEPNSGWECFGIVGGAKAVQALIESTDANYEAILKIARWLPATDEASFWEGRAHEDVEYNIQIQAVTPLAEAKSVPAYRAIRRISETAGHPKTRRYAETRLELARDSVYAGILANMLEAHRLQHDVTSLLPWVEQAKIFLRRSDSSSKASCPNPAIARALAKVWADLGVDSRVRWQAAVHLRTSKATPAFEICLSTLPLLDTFDSKWAYLLESLLVALATSNSEPVIRAVLSQVTSSGQRDVLTKCLRAIGKPV